MRGRRKGERQIETYFPPTPDLINEGDRWMEGEKGRVFCDMRRINEMWIEDRVGSNCTEDI